MYKSEKTRIWYLCHHTLHVHQNILVHRLPTIIMITNRACAVSPRFNTVFKRSWRCCTCGNKIREKRSRVYVINNKVPSRNVVKKCVLVERNA